MTRATKTADEWITEKQRQRDQKVRDELAALNKVMRALLRLPPEARPRVLRFLHDKYVIEA